MQHNAVIEPAPLDGIDVTSLPERIRRRGRVAPDATALIAGDARTSWGEMAAAMDRVAGWLSSRGVGRGGMVASVAGITPEHLILYLGVVAAGACMAPLPVSAHPDAIAAMRANGAPVLLFADKAGQAVAGEGAEPLEDLLERVRDAQPVRAEIAPSDPFDIIYSSGTTGAPKGIEHDHAFRIRQVDRFAAYGFDAQAVSIVSTPLYSNTTLSGLLPALAGGGTIVLMEKFEAGAFLALAEAHRVTHTMLVPVQYRRILAHSAFDATDLSSFRTKLSTSAPFSPAMMAEVLARWPGRMVNLYGMTEGGISVMLDASAHPTKLHTAGRPVRGAEIRIIDANGRELPQGETGEIVGRSPTMMTGYRGDPKRTHDAIWTAPGGEVFIRSGDIGRIDEDGFLCLMDRAKDMINSGGFNVFPADLEAVLESHPQVAEAAVVAIPDPEWGETPMAFVVARAGLDPEHLRLWANERLGKTQRIARLELRDTLPRSEIGKVLKRELRAPFWQS